MRKAVLVILVSLWAGGALAQRAAPTDVSPVTVMPKTDQPKVTATFPAAGQAVAPGVLVLKVTFDQHMLKTAFDVKAAPGGEAPECLQTPRLLDDGKSFVLLCKTHPGKSYALAFSTTPGGGFANIAENRALPAALTFTTTTDEPVRTMDDALKAASLRPTDLPVQVSPGVGDNGSS